MSPPELDRLLSQDDWIRRLARQLVRDPSLADDLAQDAWVAALEKPTGLREARSPRAWMKTVVRNLSLQSSRCEGRRSRRERDAARSEALPSAAEVVLEVTLRREVSDALLQLDEPYRTTLYLRFFKGLSLKRLAREQGVPVSTAHGRVQRGLEKLRSRLDRAHGGDRRAWATGLLPLAKAPLRLAGLAPTGVVMSIGMKVAASFLVVGGAIGIWLTQRDVEALTPPDPSVLEPPTAPAELATPEPRAPEASERVAELPAVNVEDPHAGLYGIHWTADIPPARGRLIDPRGLPIAGVEVGYNAFGLKGAGKTSRTDGEGRFEMAVMHPHRASYSIAEPTWFLLAKAAERVETRVSMHQARSADDPVPEIVLVAAPAATFAGRVVGPDGAPVPDAEVAFRVRTSLFNELGLGWWQTVETDVWRVRDDQPGEHVARVDEDGRFELPDVCGGPSVFCSVAAPGWATLYEAQTFDLPAHDSLDLVFVLERSEGVFTVTGTVFAPDGSPAPGTKVSMSQGIVVTDQNGDFSVPWDPAQAKHAASPEHDLERGLPAWYAPPTTPVVHAVKTGYRPVKRELAEDELDTHVLLYLGSEPLSIAGRVVDGEGKPLKGAAVWVRNPTWFGMWSMQQGESSSTVMTTVEETLRGSRGIRGVTTGEDGRFELGGLLEKTYDLQVYLSESATLGDGWDVDAGETGVELVLATEPGTRRVAGRVVSLAGEPIAGLQIGCRRGDVWDQYWNPPFNAQVSITTDERGRFEFAALATEDTRLVLNGRRILFESVALADYPDLDEVEIVQPLLCELQVDLGDSPDRADEIRVLDADGEELRIAEFKGAFLSHGKSAEIRDGMTSVVRVDERARTLVLMLEGEEVERVPIELDPDERRIVRP